MSEIYFNENTGDEVHLDGRSARLDALENWKRIDEGDKRPPIANDGILSRRSLTGPQASKGPGHVLVETTPPAPGDVPVQDTHPVEVSPATEPVKAPAKSASKADWAAYARTRAQDSDEEAAIDDLSRDELAARYGGSS